MGNPNPSPSTRFKPGQSGNPGGMKKGPVTRVKVLLAERGIHPIDEVLKLMPELRPAEQAKIWLELQTYCEARPKETDPAKDDEESDKLTEAELKLLSERARERA